MPIDDAHKGKDRRLLTFQTTAQKAKKEKDAIVWALLKHPISQRMWMKTHHDQSMQQDGDTSRTMKV